MTEEGVPYNINSPSDLMYAVAKRAQDLCDMPTRQVRLIFGSANLPTPAYSGIIGLTKGQVIEAILANEFEDVAKTLDDQ